MAAEKDLALLDDYIANRLTQEEKIVFENKLKQDTALRQELAMQQSIVDGIRLARKAELKALLNSIPTPAIETGGSASLLKWAGLGIITLLIGTGLYFYLQPESPSQGTIPIEIKDNSTHTAPPEPELSTEVAEEPAEQEEAEVKREHPVSDRSTVAESNTSEQESNLPRKLNVYDPSEELQENTQTPPSEVAGSDNLNPSSKITTKVNNTDKKYNFHYQLQQDQVTLYGSFEKDVYEILEFFANEKRTVFLFYKNNYYLLNESNQVKPLSPVNDPALLQKLKEHRSR